MKGRNIFHNWITLLVVGLFMCSLYVSYAAAVVTDPVRKDQSEGTAFTFMEDHEDFKLEITSDKVKTDNTDEKEKHKSGSVLDAFLEYNKRTLNINGTEALNMKDFLDGTISLGVSYGIRADGIAAGTEYISRGVCDLGNIPFFLSGDEPYWRIANKNGAWGIGNPDTRIPQELYKLIPENINGLLGYNTIKYCEDGIIRGTVSIGRFLTEDTKSPVINLSSLELSEKVNQQIVANNEKSSILEILVNYYFSVPVILNQKTSETFLHPTKALDYDLLTSLPQIQGKITFRIHANVIHDIQPSGQEDTSENTGTY